MDVLHIVLAAVSAIAAITLVVWERDNRQRAKSNRRRVLYDEATAGALDSKSARARLEAEQFKSDEVEFIATWKKQWDQWANPRPNESKDDEAFRMKTLNDLQDRLDELLLG